MGANRIGTIIVLDVETTGLEPTDRVVELAIIDFDTGDLLLHSYVNPGMPIPAEATAITGISDETVCGAPPFSAVAKDAARLIESSTHVVGYHVAFDHGMLEAEFQRARISCRWPHLVDPWRFWNLKDPAPERNLSGAYARFVNPAGYEGAHGALPDTKACREVLAAQLTEWGINPEELHLVDPNQARQWGPTHHIVWSEDGSRLLMNFGKMKGRPVHEVDGGFWRWLFSKDFPSHVRDLATICLEKVSVGREQHILTWARSR